jgi:imidazolonepropionase-like amidohydrolase
VASRAVVNSSGWLAELRARPVWCLLGPDLRFEGAPVRGYQADVGFDGVRVLRAGVTVLVADGRIAAVETGRCEPPAGVPVTRLAGGTVLPGLVDTHVHLCGDGGPDALARVPAQTPSERDAVVRAGLAAQLAAGVTAVRDLGDHHWAVADIAAAGPRPGEPRVVASGPPITTPGGHCASMGGAARGAVALAAAVRERAARRVGVVKVMVSGGSMTAGSDLLALQYGVDELAVIVRAAHAGGLPVTAHAHSVESVEVCLAAGVDGIEHCTCMTAGGLRRPARLFAALARVGVPVCPTLGRLPGSAPSPQAAELAARTGWSVAGRLAQVGALAAAGVRLVSGSDAGIHPGKPHGVLPHAIAELVTAGIPAPAALTSATAAAADACGLGGTTGRLRAGLSADLLLVDGDPSTDIAALTQVRHVVLRGDVVPGHDITDASLRPGPRPRTS